jgi:hypothetical protein
MSVFFKTALFPARHSTLLPEHSPEIGLVEDMSAYCWRISFSSLCRAVFEVMPRRKVCQARPGADAPSNMQWQTQEASKLKDKSE